MAKRQINPGPCFKCKKRVRWRYWNKESQRYVYWCYDHKPLNIYYK